MKNKGLFETLIAKDNKEIEKINKARDRRDRHFFEEWFDKYNKEGIFWYKDNKIGREKSRKKDWL